MRHSVISVLHHSFLSINNKMAEEEGMGWHFRSARALKNIARMNVVCVRPSGSKQSLVKVVDGVSVVLTPTLRLSPSELLWRWDEVSPELVRYVAIKVEKQGYVPYIHEYRSLNSSLLIERLKEHLMILQHHGSRPPTRSQLLSVSFMKVVKEASRILKERLLRRVHGAIFVLNSKEKEYLENLGVEALIKVRTMAVDFNEIKLVTGGEKMALRKKYGIPEDVAVLSTYVGVFKEQFSTIKGAHYISKIHKELLKYFGDKVRVVVAGVGEPFVSKLRSQGIVCHNFLPHRDYVNLIKCTDLHFLPASSAYYFGGIGVSIMEALAMGLPVVSPTLVHFPDPSNVKRIGVLTPWVNSERDAKSFVELLVYALDNIDQFKPLEVREIARKYYSWESFVQDVEQTLSKLL